MNLKIKKFTARYLFKVKKYMLNHFLEMRDFHF